MNQLHAQILLNAVRSISEKYHAETSHLEPMFQSLDGKIVLTPFKSVEELIAVHAKASVAGFLALSPEFHATGGSIGDRGAPVYDKREGAEALCAWLDCSFNFARCLVYGDCLYKHSEIFSLFHGKPLHAVSPRDFIAKIELAAGITNHAG